LYYTSTINKKSLFIVLPCVLTATIQIIKMYQHTACMYILYMYI